jgi:hypothetical protein
MRNIIARAAQMVIQLATAPFTSKPGGAPDLGSILRQQRLGAIHGEISRVLGAYNPRLVGIKDFLLMRQDPDIAFGTGIVRAPIINLPWVFEAKDPEIKAFGEAVFRPKYRQLAKAGSLAIGFGYQVVEKVWKAGPLSIELPPSENEGKKPQVIPSSPETSGVKPIKQGNRITYPMAWTFEEFKGIDPRTLALMVDEKADKWAGVKQTGYLGSSTPELVGPDRVALWSFRKDDVWGDLRGFGLYDQAYKPWYAKEAMELFANKYYERRADPTPVARAEAAVQTASGELIDGFKLMGQILDAHKNGGRIILPNKRDEKGEYSFGLDYLLDDQRGDMYQSRIDALGVQILKALWIAERVGGAGGEGGIGTGEAQVHAEVLAELLESIQNDWLDEFVNPQFVAPLIKFNFGEERFQDSGACIKAGGLSADMKTLLKELLFKLMDAEQAAGADGSVPLRKRLDADQIFEALDLPKVSQDVLKELEAQAKKEKQEADDLLKKAAAAESEPMSPAKRKAALDQMERLGIVEPEEAAA